jgi:hypothetical protein
MPQTHPVEEPPVDLEDDFEVARQECAEHAERPFLEGFGQQRVGWCTRTSPG